MLGLHDVVLEIYCTLSSLITAAEDPDSLKPVLVVFFIRMVAITTQAAVNALLRRTT